MVKLRTRVTRANERVAEVAAGVINSMWTFWLLLVVTLAPLIWPSIMPAEQYVSSGVFQAVALPLLGVSGAVQSRQMLRLMRRLMKKLEEIEGRLGSFETPEP
ncbi:hypothetical protein [Telmatospirillum sp.]|uniref:hypothetical protein n=1 Tax=Telmatospirillum sp. TaxID=2079197 RepID=UPI00283D8297|nr:hypothetical protein [Telmatospirillum sp.]MDR3438931.1 hypothetical protein [Telmatospirillum sp.]